MEGGDAGLADPTRLAALSDGLFAIVLTLLVLDIDLPEGIAGQPLEQARALWSQLFGYLLTFVIAGLYWVIHHRVFRDIERLDRRLPWLNLMFLLCVGLLPFPTRLLSSEAESDFAFGWLAYSINMVLIGVTLAAIWGYAAAQGLISSKVDAPTIRRALARSLVTPGCFALSLAVLPFDVTLASYVPLLIAPVMFLVRTPGRVRERRSPAAILWTLLAFSPIFLFVAYSVWLFNLSP
jgi:uncharacterized membrane protein